MTGRLVPRGLAFHASTGREWRTEAIGRYIDLLIELARAHPELATPDYLDRIERALADYEQRSVTDLQAHLRRTAQATDPEQP